MNLFRLVELVRARNNKKSSYHQLEPANIGVQTRVLRLANVILYY